MRVKASEDALIEAIEMAERVIILCEAQEAWVAAAHIQLGIDELCALIDTLKSARPAGDAP